MKKFVAGAAIAAALVASPAAALDFSFAGNLADPNDVLFFDFNVGSPSNVTLRTYSYAGGTNAAGNVIARGGFDPILSLYSLGSGLRIGYNDDGGCGLVAADAVSGRCWDTFLQTPLAAGAYRVAVTAYQNLGPDSLSGTFAGAGSFNGRDSHFAFDVLNVDAAVGPGGPGEVPEPATWATMILGLGAVGAAMRRRKTQVRFSFA